MAIIVKKFHNDQPSDSDLFNTGGGHNYVATQIINYINNNKSPCIIGLEGELGSGKSTIIEIIKKDVTNDEHNNIHMLIFDVDKYHMDIKTSLVRVIYDKVSEVLTNYGVDSKIKNKLDEIANKALGRLSIINRANNFMVNHKVPFLLLLCFLLSSLAPHLINELYLFLRDPFNNESLIGYHSVAFAILFIILLCMLAANKGKVFLSNVIKPSGSEEITEITVISDKVGTIELEKYFKGLVDLMPEGLRLILVLDNIERLSYDAVKSVWGELDIFMELNCPNFRIIIPFSKSKTISAIANGDSSKYAIAYEYITKRLSVIFTTPPLLSVRWKEQFVIYCKEVFGDDIDVMDVIELIELWHVHAPTPRYLKHLINRVATKIISCPVKEVNITVIFACILIDNDIESIQKINEYNSLLLVKGDNVKFDNNEFSNKINRTMQILSSNLNEDDWKKDVVCLFYHSELDLAITELLSDDIGKMLQLGDTDRCETLIKVYGFKRVFQEYINKHFSNNSNLSYAKDAIVATNLVKICLKIFNIIDDPDYDSMRKEWSKLNMPLIEPGVLNNIDDSKLYYEYVNYPYTLKALAYPNIDLWQDKAIIAILIEELFIIDSMPTNDKLMPQYLGLTLTACALHLESMTSEISLKGGQPKPLIRILQNWLDKYPKYEYFLKYYIAAELALDIIVQFAKNSEMSFDLSKPIRHAINLTDFNYADFLRKDTNYHNLQAIFKNASLTSVLKELDKNTSLILSEWSIDFIKGYQQYCNEEYSEKLNEYLKQSRMYEIVTPAAIISAPHMVKFIIDEIHSGKISGITIDSLHKAIIHIIESGTLPEVPLGFKDIMQEGSDIAFLNLQLEKSLAEFKKIAPKHDYYPNITPKPYVQNIDVLNEIFYKIKKISDYINTKYCDETEIIEMIVHLYHLILEPEIT